MKTLEDIPGNIDAWLAQAVAQLQHGRLAEAETLLQRILKANPDHTDAKHLLGIVAIQCGQYERATQLIARAIKQNPRVAMFHSNLGYALYLDGRLQEALSACEQATQLDPNLTEAFHNRGNILRGLGRLNEALVAYDRAIQLRPEYADAHYNRGNLLLTAGRAREAEGSYRRALELNPHNAGAYNNLGVVLVDAGKFEEALAACDRAIQLKPDYAQAYNCRADALRRLFRLGEALQACDKAIELKSDYAEAHYNRGNVLLAAGRVEEAEDSYRRALELNPDNAQLHSNILFTQAARARLSFDQMCEAMREWDRVHGREGRLNPLPARTATSSAERRLRVGYVSPHLRSHVINFFFEPLLAAHDRTHFEIFCYASYVESRSDEVTQRLRAIAEHWRFVGDKNDAALARLVHEDGIDILVDLTGHTAGNRLKAFTYRPAPVQATYLGFFAATGLAAMDYWITDEVLHPPDTPELATEKIYRLPRCWVCYQPSNLAPAVAPCPTSDARVVFGSFNDFSKLTPDVIETWSRLLQRLPGSRLLVMARTLGDPMNRSLLTEGFASHGIAPERLLLRKGAPYRQYYATYADVDIALDPFPRTGGTTTAEALWMGVPVVTLAGQRYVERISASKLTAVGLEDLIAGSREEYIEKAISLAHDPARRADLRRNLRERMAQSPLCDGEGLARAMEFAYTDMWNRYLAGSS
jgi:predicted O-linked N-acetylglucosamine transferase (SPINDLY family)